MDTFSAIREHLHEKYTIVHDEPFVIGIEIPLDDSRQQSIFLAELKDRDNHRFLRIESTIAPLESFEAEKCLRINLLLRIGYLAVGDLESVPYIKLCENVDYRTLDTKELDFIISRIAPLADQLEQQLSDGLDIS